MKQIAYTLCAGHPLTLAAADLRKRIILLFANVAELRDQHQRNRHAPKVSAATRMMIVNDASTSSGPPYVASSSEACEASAAWTERRGAETTAAATDCVRRGRSRKINKNKKCKDFNISI